MILTDQDILKILKERPNSAMLEDAKKSSKKFIAHITGQGSDKLIEQISGLENEKQLEIRKKYAQSNKAIFSRIHRNEDKIFSAKGGSVFYNVPESQKKFFVSQLQNIYNGFSARSWTENYAKQYFHLDPMGVILMEVGNNVTYPIYKSTESIYDYQLKGREVEYLILTTKEPNEYRVIDDQFDKIVKYEGEVVTTKADVYPNYFGKVPAIVISDIVKPNTQYYTSPDDEIIEIADEFLRESSVKSIFKLKFGYSKQWAYAAVCNNCKGTGLKGGDDCKTCNGSGRAVITDSSEVIALPIPEDGQGTITPPTGFVSPDVAGWDKMTDELRLLENQMHNTYWGVEPLQQTTGPNNQPIKTATEIADNNQPIYARLSKLSKWAEGIEKFITDLVGQFYLNSSYKGCSISYGTRYGIEGPDTIFLKYQDARSKGAPDSVLDALLLEYYESKYSTNNMELAKQVKLMKVEPFIHLTVSQAKNIIPSPVDYNKKLYYLEWLNTLPENEVIIKSTADLVKSLSEYASTKEVPKPEPIIKP